MTETNAPKGTVVETYIHSIMTIVVAIGGWVIKIMWDSLKDLQRDDEQITEKVSDLQVLVAGNYVTREELRSEFTNLKATLCRIESKLDQKADK